MTSDDMSHFVLYRALLGSRLAEEHLNQLAVADEIGVHHSGLNHEAIGIAIGLSVEFDDYVQPSYRSGGTVMRARGLTLRESVLQAFGLIPGIREQHPGGPRTLRSTGILGGQLPTAVGVAMACKLRDSRSIVVSVIGDGASNEGAVHESFNLAGAKSLPIIFVIENNGIALSTRASDSCGTVDLARRGQGYGIKAAVVDGNDAVATYEVVHEEVRRTRSTSAPALIEVKLTRPGDHAAGLLDVRTDDEVRSALSADVVANLRERLLRSGELDVETDADLRRQLAEIIDVAVEEAREQKSRRREPSDESPLSEADVWRMAHASAPPSWMEGVH